MIHFSHYAAAFNILGTCYLFSPNDDASHYAISFFKLNDFASQWPCKISTQLSERISASLSIEIATLHTQWTNLFIGPEAYLLRHGARYTSTLKAYYRALRHWR